MITSCGCFNLSYKTRSLAEMTELIQCAMKVEQRSYLSWLVRGVCCLSD